MMKSNFTMIPNDLLYDLNVPAKAKALYGVLSQLAYRSRDKICFVGLRTLTKSMNIGSTNTMKRLTEILEKNGWIEILKQYKGRCTGYRVHFKKCDTKSKNCDGSDSINETQLSQELKSINNNNEYKEEDIVWKNELWNN